MFDQPRTFWTDFNSVEDDGRIAALVDSGVVPEVGTYVILKDTDGNRCEAVVIDAEPDFFWAQPFWQTWQAAVDAGDLIEALRALVVASARPRDDSNDAPTKGGREPSVFEVHAG